LKFLSIDALFYKNVTDTAQKQPVLKSLVSKLSSDIWFAMVWIKTVTAIEDTKSVHFSGKIPP